MGWCGLKFRPERNKVYLGYSFVKKYWGAGYATEAAKRCMEYGFRVLQLDRIFAAAHVDNITSQIVLLKAGLTYRHDEIIDNCPVKTYEAINPIFNLAV